MANATWANRYNASQPIPDKQLEPDGSITTLSGTVISGPNTSLAQRYATSPPFPDKWVNPDGSITTGNAGGGGGGGGTQIIQVADQATAIAQSTANPNNIYFWV